MLLETIKLSTREKEMLMRVKRDTRIKNWNVLCRWALCLSLAEPTAPPTAEVTSDSSVEMSWRVFGGKDADLLEAMVRVQAARDLGVEATDEDLHKYFRLHLRRGVGYLFGDQSLKSLVGLVGRGLSGSRVTTEGVTAT